ncbi:alternative ribosome-rescue factor A [Aeromonas veronii]|uniref:alternative ribosome-rescue factor A n=1 Tax=Aeromonas TaxID=642 RepID=UPI0032ECEFFB
MAKKRRVDIIDQAHDHQRGIIQDNHLKALVTSPLFQARVEASKKGKGSYQRKAKHGKRWEPGQQRMQRVCC